MPFFFSFNNLLHPAVSNYLQFAAIKHNISFLKISVPKLKYVLNKRKFLNLEKYFALPPAYFPTRIFSLFSITPHHALFLQIFIYHHLHAPCSLDFTVTVTARVSVSVPSESITQNGLFCNINHF